MTHSDPSLTLLADVVRGRCSRRELMVRAAALGLGAPAVMGLMAAMPREAGAQTAPAGTLTWALDAPPPNLIPFGAIALAQWQGKEFMYDSLLMWDKDLIVQPALAESWETPDDHTYVFHLRKGVKFHDGGEMTAKDVKYSLETALNPPEPGVKVPYLGNVASVEAVDDYTVKVTMTKADPTLPGTLAWTNYTAIVPEGLLTRDGFNPLSDGVGTGPFKLKEFVQDDSLTYEAFPDHWQTGVPGVATLILKVLTDEQARVASLRAGEVDGGTFTPDTVLSLQSDTSLTVLKGLTSAPHVVQFNMVKDVPWRDIRVRQAINLVHDRQEVIDKVYGGEAVLTTVIPPGYGDWPLPNDALVAAYTVDIDKAKQLMSDAGLADGFDVELQAIAAPREYTQIAEILKEQCKQININVTVQPLEIGTFADNIGKGNFSWASTGRGMRGDPSGHVVDFRSGTANNVNWFGDGWKSEEFDSLYDEALATVDQAKRHELYNRMQEIVLSDVPNLYSVVPYKYQVVTGRVQGMYVFYGNTNPGLRTATVTG